MLLRYLVLFGGVVLMINGCNGLISGTFGTHRLRTLTLRDVQQSKLGDADFVALTGGQVHGSSVIVQEANWWGETCTLRAYLSPEQTRTLAAGSHVSPSVIAYQLSSHPAAAQNEATALPGATEINGLIGQPPAAALAPGLWKDLKLDVPDNVYYLQLGEEPMPWYWNLCLFLGGLIVAGVPEALRFRKE